MRAVTFQPGTPRSITAAIPLVDGASDLDRRDGDVKVVITLEDGVA